jgi:hypothetical protein
MIKSGLVLLLAGLSLAACGGEEPGFDEEGELDTAVEAVTNVDHCATGTTPNATSNFPGGGADAYTRPADRANPGGPCGSNPRSATYVEFDATPGHVIHFMSSATFTGIPLGLCPANTLVFKVEKFVNGAFELIHNVTVNGVVQGSYCRASATYGLYPPDATGNYRIRTVAPRFDGLVETVRVWGDDQSD